MRKRRKGKKQGKDIRVNSLEQWVVWKRGEEARKKKQQKAGISPSERQHVSDV